MRRFSVAVVVLCLVSLGGSVAQAQAVLDQSMTMVNNGGTFVGAGLEVGQTFTAGRSGSLTRVDLLLSQSPGRVDRVIVVPAPDLIVTIQATTNGAPNGTVLATQTIPSASFASLPINADGAIEVTFSSPASIQAGTTYAIAMAAPNTFVPPPGTRFFPGGYNTNSFTFGPDFFPVPDPYPGGQAFFRDAGTGFIWVRDFFDPSNGSDGDYYFATYVGAPATPASLTNDLINEVKASLGSASGSYVAKLNAALASLASIKRGHKAAAANQLKAFQNAVKAQSGKKISAATAAKLIADAQDIINRL